MNYNMSRSLQVYVDAANRYPRARLSPPRETATATAAGFSDWDLCGRSAAWFASLASARPGDNDSLGITVDPDISIPGWNPPWSTSRDFSWRDYPGWTYLYESYGSVVTCYGTAWDPESLNTALKEEDMCQMKLASVVDCLGGWNARLFARRFCADYTQCVADFKTNTERWAKFGGVNSGTSAGYALYQLPAGWDRLDDFRDSLRDELSSEIYDVAFSELWAWIAFHVPLLAIASIGWILLVTGVIAALRVRADAAPEGSGFQEFPFQSVSGTPLLNTGDQTLESRTGFPDFDGS
jgi:hypothetical protein